MDNEYQILNHLHENEKTTQRRISSNTGLSLGAVNLLLKRMVRKGLVKVEKINARNVRYVLTPQGMQEKAQLTYSYIRHSYKQLIKINHALNELLNDYSLQFDGMPVLIFGPVDEIREIITQRLSDLALKYESHSNLKTLTSQGTKTENQLIITWRVKEEEAAATAALRPVNIMKRM